MKPAAAGLLYLEYAALTLAASEPTRPRGVSPEFAKHYKDSTIFSCISDPSIQFPFARVNDDYCDCPDGSDEPGTSACAHLSSWSPQTPTNSNVKGEELALPGFYCKNKGHMPSYVPFTNVNDGICDYELCCDGSEEWEGVGGVKCEDRCKAIGKEWRAQDEKRQKSLGAAAKKRKEMVLEAGKLRKQVQDRTSTLKTEIEGGKIKVEQLSRELGEVERRERGKVVKGSKDGKGQGKLGVLVGLARQRVDELRVNLVRVREERDMARGRLEQLEGILKTFKEEYNPNFNDEGVKRAVRGWEDYAASGVPLEEEREEAAGERDLDEMTKSDEETEEGIKWDEYEGGEEGSEVDVLYAFENYLPPTLRTWVDQKLRDLRVTLIDNGILADSSTNSKAESKAVTDARKARDTAQKDLEKSRKDLKNHSEDLEKDMGPDDVFRALKGQCVSTDSGEYTYEVCFLDKTTQKPKKGGGHTNMGNFAGMERVQVDEEVAADGKGLGVGERWAMKFDGGQHCWNGPNRRSLVVMGCAEQGEVWKVMEEEKCVYRVEVGTPAVCEGANGNGTGGKQGKDEL